MWIIGILVCCVVGLSTSIPAPASGLQYDLGVSYKYAYHFAILLNEDANITSRSAAVGRNVGYKVASEFVITNVWQSTSSDKEKLLKLEVLQPTLHVSSALHSSDGISKHWSKLDNLSYPPIYIHWNNGAIKTVYTFPDEPSMINIKKGIASLFQMRIVDGQVKELDVAGLCSAHYKVHGTTIKKTKNHCEGTRTMAQHRDSNHLRLPAFSTSSETIINLTPQQGIIHSISGTEEVMMTLNLWKQAAIFVKTKLHVSLIESYENPAAAEMKDLKALISELSKETGQKLRAESLEVVPEQNKCGENCPPLRALVKEYAHHLRTENLGKIKSTAAFLKILDGFRRASSKELLMLFKDADEKILTQLLDILAATQTHESLEVAFQLIDFESKDIGIAERFLLCLATTPYPNEELITRTLKLTQRKIKSEKLRSTILVALSSIVRMFCKNNPKNEQTLIVQTVNDLLLKELEKCDNEACVANHLLALRNAAFPKFIPVVLNYVKKGGVVGLVALESLKEIGEEHFTKEVKNVLARVYNQFWPHQESAARVLAAELLIKSSPTVETIGELLLSLSDREQPEVTTLVLSKLQEAAGKNATVRACLHDVLENMAYGNYNNLAQNGSSTAYTKLLQASHDANITYGINMEMRPTGMLKRTSIDLNLFGQQDNMHLLSLGLFVEGFGLTDEEQKLNPQEHSAGMQLSVLGVHLRPYIFFTGTAELMGLVWSSAGSEPTPALQANFLFMDQSHSFVLQNGVPLEFLLKGALSTDISGTVEVSMWNKNSHAVVKSNGALLVNGLCRVDTSFVESHVDFALGGSSTLDMVVDLDFAEKPMKICLQVEQPDFIFRHNVRKTETIPGSKHLIKTVKRRSIYFPGKSFNLHQKNSDSCKALLFPKPSSSYW